MNRIASEMVQELGSRRQRAAELERELEILKHEIALLERYVPRVEAMPDAPMPAADSPPTQRRGGRSVDDETIASREAAMRSVVAAHNGRIGQLELIRAVKESLPDFTRNHMETVIKRTSTFEKAPGGDILLKRGGAATQ